MKTCTILEQNRACYDSPGKRYIIVNDNMIIGDYDAPPPKLKDKDYHMTLEAAKNIAYEEGYRAYTYKGKTITFRETRVNKGCPWY